MDKLTKLRRFLEDICAVIPSDEFEDPVLITKFAAKIALEMGLIDENHNLTKEAIQLL